MTRNLKALGLSLVALVAVSAIAASAAQATAGELDIGTSPAILTGQQTAHLKLRYTQSGLTLQCTQANLEGTTQSSSVSEAQVTPQYGGCTYGGVASSIDVNGCKFTMTGGVAANTAQVDIVGCTSSLTITQGSCSITVKEQGPLSHIVFSNVPGSPTHIAANFTIQGIHYEGDAGCGTNVIGTHVDGDLTGEMTIKAFSDNNGFEGGQVALETT